INESIIKAYTKLYEQGIAHSIECWDDDVLVGGLYGLKIGGAFFGESMFSRATDASKIALVHLVARLWQGGFKILDTQFVNDHLMQFGVYEISHYDYMKALASVLDIDADFSLNGKEEREILDAYLAFRDEA
ncbi:MAG: leucyl/phenylalanyl-tRNA--protein transferase, partial [Pseudomonadota bacterium]